MTPETLQTKDLIRALVASFVERPEALKLEAQEANGDACYWMLKGHRDDDPRLVGSEGSHVNALTFLVEQLGRVNGKVYTFRLLTEPRNGERARLEPRDVITYNPEPAKELLCRILDALGFEGFGVAVGPGAGPRTSLTFVFTVGVADASDYMALTVPPVPGVSGIESTVVGAVGTLFRAIAKRDGVRFQITIQEPK